MKQHITPKQLNELSKKGKKKLKKWWKPQYGDQFVFEKSVCTVFGDSLPAIMELKRRKKDRQVPLLSIGQMIELLGAVSIMRWVKRRGWRIGAAFHKEEELCDALWGGVKKVLKNEKHFNFVLNSRKRLIKKS